MTFGWSEFGVTGMSEGVDASLLASAAHASGGAEGYFLGTLCTLVLTQHCLTCRACLSIVSDRVHPFMTTVSPSSAGCFTMCEWRCNCAFIFYGIAKRS